MTRSLHLVLSCILFACVRSGCLVAAAAGAEGGAGLHGSSAQATPGRWIIQAHRGAGNLAPENTLPTFELAWRLGVVPEADVRTTKDGVLVAFHDETFKRLVKGASPELKKKGVGDLVWEELSRLDVGAWKGKAFEGQRVPRMSDVFKAMEGRPDRWLYLDIKKVPLETLAELVKEFKVERQVILATTHYPMIQEWKALVPESQTLLWMGGTETILAGRLRELKASDFKGVTQLQIHVTVGDPKAGDPFTPRSSFLQSVGVELRRRSILFQVLPWGQHEVAVYQRLLDLGVQSFATDDPPATLKAVQTYQSPGSP